MEILFCYLNQPGNSQDINWLEEADAAEECDFSCHSFSYDLFYDGQIDLALQELPDGEGIEILYRGWMMGEEDYGLLDEALSDRGYRLIVGQHEYRETVTLPNYFEAVEDLTPPALWTDEPDIEEAWELAGQFKGAPLIVKDHMKSAKEAWLEACFVPEGASFDVFKSICEELRDRRGESFANGFVIRPFIPLKRLGAHWTGSPISEEYRMFFWKGERILSAPYFEIGSDDIPDFSAYDVLGDRIDSSFFVADVAIRETGEPVLIEVNPAGCAGFPPQLHPIEFYEKLAQIV